MPVRERVRMPVWVRVPVRERVQERVQVPAQVRVRGCSVQASTHAQAARGRAHAVRVRDTQA